MGDSFLALAGLGKFSRFTVLDGPVQLGKQMSVVTGLLLEGQSAYCGRSNQ